MRLGIDEYNHLASPLHRWDPRFKLIGLIVLVFAFSFVRDLRMLLVIAVTTAVIYTVSKLPAAFLRSRLRYPSYFLVVLLLTLPFLAGNIILLNLGPLAVRQEGLLSALLIGTRFVCIVTIGIVLISTTPLLTNIKAMRALGLPAIMADMALLALRYLQEIGADLRRMQTSMRLRGFHAHRFSWRGLRVLAWLSGSLLVYSYERSETIYKAMILRGYGYGPSPQSEFHSNKRDNILLVAVILAAVGIIIGDVAFGHNTAALLQ